jgi:DNA-binding winged helix-turn-helix (wHTH) protein/tetratricopeptide (TPR) repeat protein
MTNLPPSPVYEFGDFRMDVAERQLLRRDGTAVPLKPRVFETLRYLVENGGRLLDKEVFMKAVWPDSIVEENNLTQNISALRRAFGEIPGSPHYIVTVPGRGYRFVADIKISKALPAAPSHAAIRTIAVLPFKPLVIDDRDASLELGMADTLIARLSSLREIVVRPLSSVRKYVDLDQEPLLAGRELGVESVLDGSIQKRGGDIRVTVRLLSVANGGSLWSGTFDEKFTDIFSVQDAIAERVVAALALQLSVDEKRGLTKHHTENAEAYQLYLKGRYHWWKTTPEAYRRSRDYFQQAVDADPSYALGYCGLSSFYGFGAAWGMLPPNQSWPRAIAANARAMELDDTLVQVHNDLGAINMVFHRNWNTAEKEIRRALALNPQFEEVHYLYSFYLIVTGRVKEAIEEGRRALELDPLSVRINQHLGNSYYQARQYNEAIVQYREALELDPQNASVHESLGDALEKNELPDEAVAEWQRAMILAGDNELAATVRSAQAKGFAAAVGAVEQKKLERLGQKSERGEYVPAISYARAYLRLGDKKQAFQWLKAAGEERNVFALLLKSDPFYDSIREDPRFGAILDLLDPSAPSREPAKCS